MGTSTERESVCVCVRDRKRDLTSHVCSSIVFGDVGRESSATPTSVCNEGDTQETSCGAMPRTSCTSGQCPYNRISMMNSE